MPELEALRHAQVYLSLAAGVLLLIAFIVVEKKRLPC